MARERSGGYSVDGSEVRQDAGHIDASGDDEQAAIIRALTVARSLLHDAAASVRLIADDLCGLEPTDDLPVDVLDDCFAELKRLDGAHAAVKARLVACAKAASSHRRSGMANEESYLRDRLGTSTGEAKRQTKLAEALSAMPEAADAVAKGELGTEQATILGRALKDGWVGDADQIQDSLLETAKRESPERLIKAIRRKEQEADAKAQLTREQLAHARRRASMSKNDETGMWHLSAQLDPVAGELVHTALSAFTTFDGADTPDEGKRTFAQRTADGLTELAEHALKVASDGSAGSSSAGVRPHVSLVVHATPADLDPDAGNGARVGGDGKARASTATTTAGQQVPPLPYGPGVTGTGQPLSIEATARLVCDSALTRIVMGAPSEILDTGRTKRGWTTPQRRAIDARDGGCRGPGCDRPPSWCHAHHVHWWSNGGATSTGSGLLLCTVHHQMVHEGGWELTFYPDDGRAVYIDPGGNKHTTYPRGPAAHPPDTQSLFN